MNITDIKIRKIIPEGRLRAIISITIDDMLAIHDIKVVQGDERLFVAMPSRRDENGMFRDIVHPKQEDASKVRSLTRIPVISSLCRLNSKQNSQALSSDKP